MFSNHVVNEVAMSTPTAHAHGLVHVTLQVRHPIVNVIIGIFKEMHAVRHHRWSLVTVSLVSFYLSHLSTVVFFIYFDCRDNLVV